MTKLQVSALIAASGLASVAIAQPANDNLAGAVGLAFPITGVTGTTLLATNQGNTAGACGNSATSADVWFQVTVPTAQSVVVSTCGETPVDTVVQVFNVGAGNTLGAQVACDDDACQNRRSRATFNAVAGASYFVRVATKLGTTGDFQLNVTPSTTPNPVDVIQTVGPDVTIGNLSDVYYWGASGSTKAFSVGTDSWNIGDRQADWFDYATTLVINGQNVPKGSNEHPVIGQQMYRLKDGKFEQIGISWLKHGFTSLNSNSFSNGMAVPSFASRGRVLPTVYPDTTPSQNPNPSSGDWLGVNASDLYSASLNGTQSAGPRWDVNPLTGQYTHPFTALVAPAAGTIGRRLQVPIADLGDTSARYFVDAVYITSDDMPWGNGRNNYASRELNANTTNAVSVGSSAVTFAGGTARRMTALELWPEIDRSVRLANVDVFEQTVQVRDYTTNPFTLRSKDLFGRFQVASKVTDVGGGQWSYEYAVMNLQSHRSSDGFSVRLPANAGVTGTGFRSAPYHSSERIDNTPWMISAADGRVGFNVNMSFPPTETFSGIGEVTMAPNALRWGALHNYRFVTTVPPVVGTAKLDLWRSPASPSSGFQGSVVAVNGIWVPQACLADIAGPGPISTPDGELTADDIILFLNAFTANNLTVADVSGPGLAPEADNELTADDIIRFVNSFVGNCQ
jgi:hypothetical protein